MSGRSSIVDTYYCCLVHDHSIQLASLENSSFAKYIEKLSRELWERQALAQGYDPIIIQAYGEKLSKAIKQGFGKDYIDIDYDHKDYGLLHSLESNVWQFSTAKNYQQLKQMSEALIKPDGTRRSFDEFRIQTALITGEQLRHLKTEYQTAVAGAQMAAKWNEIQKNKDIYPLLEFIAIEDDHTSALCRSLNGVIRPVDDAFWMQFYPPNHYNCRSTVKQLRKGDITDEDKIIRPNIPGIFKVNLSERGLAFPEDHAYFDGMPAEVMKEARKHFPYNMQFDLIDQATEAKGIVRQHFLVDTQKSDYNIVRTVAEEFAQDSKLIADILPEIDNAAQRQVIFPDAKGLTNPDLRIDKELHDIKSISSTKYNTIRNAIDKAYKQVNNVIIDLPQEISLTEMYRISNGRFMDHKDLKKIYFRYNGQYYLSTREVIYPTLLKSKGDITE